MSDGWAEVSLGFVAEAHRRRVEPALLGETLLIHYSIPVLDETDLPVAEPASRIASQKFAVLEDSVLVSLLNPRIPRVWRAVGGANTVCSTEFAVLRPLPDAPLLLEYLLACCQTTRFWERLQSRAVGTTGSRQRAKVGGLLTIPILLPSIEEQASIVDLLSAMTSEIEAIEAEGRAARSLRATIREGVLLGEPRIDSRYDSMRHS